MYADSIKFSAPCLVHGTKLPHYGNASCPYVSTQSLWLQCACVSEDGLWIAVSGRRGCCIFRTDLGRWRFFGDLTHERSFHCTGMAWMCGTSDTSPLLFAACDLQPQGRSSHLSSAAAASSRSSRASIGARQPRTGALFSVNFAHHVVDR